MNIKYIGLDVHKETISIAVMNGEGKLVMESIIETKAITILQFIQGLRGALHGTLEEGTWAAWLYDLLKPQVRKLVVCDPRKSALMKEGNKSDKIDARKLADLLRGGYLRSVYHGENGLRTVKELARSYLTISKDLSRVMNRVKALYRSWGILCGGQQVYAPRHRSEWLSKSGEAGGPSFSTNSSMLCELCAKPCGEICWPRAENMALRNCCARFLTSVRFGPLC